MTTNNNVKSRAHGAAGGVLRSGLLAGVAALSALTASAEPQDRCYFNPVNGHVLVNNTSAPQYGHTVEIENGMAGDAIIRIRDSSSGQLRVSFFVKQGQTAAFDYLPDGTYTIQYAFGDALSSDCRSFVNTYSADKFPYVESFVTSYVGNDVETDILSYTLYPTDEGTVTPQSISAAEFNRD